ncbi:MAG: hypothetical protein IKM44_00105 [Clostridia bacterium]|nr:hypothetical protein [Clostridia bacterium]
MATCLGHVRLCTLPSDSSPTVARLTNVLRRLNPDFVILSVVEGSHTPSSPNILSPAISAGNSCATFGCARI